jgi:hypothetical protein
MEKFDWPSGQDLGGSSWEFPEADGGKGGPPNFRTANGMDGTCSECRHMRPDSTCGKYAGAPVSPEKTCDGIEPQQQMRMMR